MTEKDVPAVWAIEIATFSTPWTQDTFRSLLARAPVELLVYDLDGEVVGYAVLWCIADEGELANIAIREDLRGGGLGSGLLDSVIGVAVRRGVRNLYLEVRPSNERAGRLYESRGFVQVGERRNYYSLPKEDARVLKLELPRALEGD